MISTSILKIKMLRISTFNIQNDFGKYDSQKTEKIFDYLVKNKIDILGVQELYSKCSNDLEEKLKEINYCVFGKYRFFLKKLLNRVNERVAIITDKEILEDKTYRLPSFPSPLKRIVTKTVILYKGRKISVYNTHLDYRSDKIKMRELRKLYNLISEDDNLIILMGDFNLKNNKKIFNDFVRKLELNNIRRVEINDKTFKNSRYKRAIDHIFLSENFKVLERKVVKDLSISDHYPILICVEI